MFPDKSMIHLTTKNVQGLLTAKSTTFLSLPSVMTDSMFVSPLNSMWKSIAPCDDIGRWDVREVIRSWGWSPCDGITALIRNRELASYPNMEQFTPTHICCLPCFCPVFLHLVGSSPDPVDCRITHNQFKAFLLCFRRLALGFEISASDSCSICFEPCIFCVVHWVSYWHAYDIAPVTLPASDHRRCRAHLIPLRTARNRRNSICSTPLTQHLTPLCLAFPFGWMEGWMSGWTNRCVD